MRKFTMNILRDWSNNWPCMAYGHCILENKCFSSIVLQIRVWWPKLLAIGPLIRSWAGRCVLPHSTTYTFKKLSWLFTSVDTVKSYFTRLAYFYCLCRDMPASYLLALNASQCRQLFYWISLRFNTSVWLTNACTLYLVQGSFGVVLFIAPAWHFTTHVCVRCTIITKSIHCLSLEIKQGFWPNKLWSWCLQTLQVVSFMAK